MPQNTPSRAQAAQQIADADALVAENASLRDRMLRALAEVENTRRRADRAALDASRFAIADFAPEILNVADNLQRTLGAVEHSAAGSADEAALIEGVRATLRMLMQILERFGVRKIEALGRPFDPAVHEAVLQVDDPAQAPGTVVRVVEDGYLIHDRLLRAARVAVARRPAEMAPAPSAAAPADLQSHPDDRSD